MSDRIFGLALVGLVLLVWYLFHRADSEVEASVTRALGPVVPLEDLMHEQDSAEAYDDLPDMDVEAGITYGPRQMWGGFGGIQDGDDNGPAGDTTSAFADDYNAVREEMRQATLEHLRQRKAWVDEWNERLGLDFEEGSR